MKKLSPDDILGISFQFGPQVGLGVIINYFRSIQGVKLKFCSLKTKYWFLFDNPSTNTSKSIVRTNILLA